MDLNSASRAASCLYSLFRRFQGGIRAVERTLLTTKYLASGRRPWTAGYRHYREDFLRKVLASKEMLEAFRKGDRLPPGYGCRVDERVVEYPWVIGRLKVGAGLLLDAGSALNHGFLIEQGPLNGKKMVVYTLSPEQTIRSADISYIYGDLRDTILREGRFDEIVCISTLEHVGMDNTLLYAESERFKERQTGDYLGVVEEFRRLLMPGGKLMITVPYGRYENLGWQQQFDEPMINAVLDTFAGSSARVAYYQYTGEGWQISSADTSARCRYFDIRGKTGYDPDYAAAARAVACIELIK